MRDLRQKSLDRLFALSFYVDESESWTVKRLRIVVGRNGIRITVYVSPWWWLLLGVAHWWLAAHWQAKAMSRARRLNTRYGIVEVKTWTKKNRLKPDSETPIAN